jgi:hypothetical protein
MCSTIVSTESTLGADAAAFSSDFALQCRPGPAGRPAVWRCLRRDRAGRRWVRQALAQRAQAGTSALSDSEASPPLELERSVTVSEGPPPRPGGAPTVGGCRGAQPVPRWRRGWPPGGLAGGGRRAAGRAPAGRGHWPDIRVMFASHAGGTSGSHAGVTLTPSPRESCGGACPAARCATEHPRFRVRVCQ